MIKIFFQKKLSLPILGRWAIKNCEIKINRNIDLNNEDHCGCCFENKDKIYTPKEKESEKKDEKYYKYLF
jgi:hypothetical protein